MGGERRGCPGREITRLRLRDQTCQGQMDSGKKGGRWETRRRRERQVEFVEREGGAA